MDRKVIEDFKASNEVSQLKTRCAILESQVEVLERQNADLKATITILHPDTISSKDASIKDASIKDGWRDIPGLGKFPVKEIIDDGSFQV